MKNAKDIAQVLVSQEYLDYMDAQMALSAWMKINAQSTEPVPEHLRENVKDAQVRYQRSLGH